MGTLFIVATPIGNLQDITIRAIETLTSVTTIISERPEKTHVLLSEIKKRYPSLVSEKKKAKIISMNEYEEHNKIQEIISLLETEDIALVSEAGTPVLSDPGFIVVREAWRKKIKVVPIPGASAITASLSASPLPTDKFLFLGFLPKSGGKKESLLLNLKETLTQMDKAHLSPTVVLFESPHRLLDSLHVLQKTFGNIQIVVARELTKMYEEFMFESIETVIAQYKEHEPKGEFVLLFSFKQG